MSLSLVLLVLAALIAARALEDLKAKHHRPCTELYRRRRSF